MKSAFLSRRHRNPQQHHEPDKEQPFFSKSNDQGKQPFFQAGAQSVSGQPIQAKLSIGQPSDKYEQEADAVADQVVNGQPQTPVLQRQEISTVQRATLATPQEDEKLSTAESRMEKDKLVQEKPELQRMEGGEEEEPVQMMESEEEEVQMQQEEEEPVQMMEGEEEEVQMQQEEEEPVQMMEGEEEEVQMQQEEEEPVQMMEGEEEEVQMQQEEEEPVQMMEGEEEEVQMQQEEEEVQMKTEASGTTAGPQLSSRIQNSAGRGRPLPGKARSEMENAFGVNFGGVNIHTDTEAVQMNKELGAQAFTHGQDVYFNSGKYNPENSSGKRLLAHELTHVVQQGGGSSNQPIQPYRSKDKFNFNRKAPGETDSLVEENFDKKSKTDKANKPWIKDIYIHFYDHIIDDDGDVAPVGFLYAKYNDMKNPLPGFIFLFGVSGGKAIHGYTDRGDYSVTRIEGVGYNDVPLSDGEGPRKKYAKDLNSSMSYAIFFHGGQAIHAGAFRTGSHGCVHVDWGSGSDMGDLASLKRLNYHSVVGLTKVHVSYTPEILDAICCARAKARGLKKGNGINPCDKHKAETCP